MKFPRRVTRNKGWLTIDRRHDDLDIVFFCSLFRNRKGRKKGGGGGGFHQKEFDLIEAKTLNFIYLFIF